MTAQLDQRVPLPSLCRRRVWLVLKPMLLLAALAVAVVIARSSQIPRWMSAINSESTIWGHDNEDADSVQPVHRNDITVKPMVETRQKDLSSLSAEEQVSAHLRDAHPMLYPFEEEQIVAALTALGDHAIPPLIELIKRDSLNGVRIHHITHRVAMKALGRIGASALPFLKPLIEQDDPSSVTWRATFTCQYMRDSSEASQVITVDWSNIESEYSSYRFYVLPYVDPSPDTVARYIKLLGRSEPNIRQTAIRVLPAFGRALSPHIEAIKKLSFTPDIEIYLMTALWVSGDEDARNIVRKKMDLFLANPAEPDERALKLFAVHDCLSLAEEYAARLRVIFDENPEDKVKAQAVKLLADVDPTFAPPRESLFLLMEKLRHHEREAVYYYLFRKEGQSPVDILNARREVSPAELERVKQLIASSDSTDKDVVKVAQKVYGSVDSYTHPLFVPMMRVPKGRTWYARYGTGDWLPVWIRLPAYEAVFISDPAAFYSGTNGPTRHLNDLRRMRQSIIDDSPELIQDYEDLLATVERYKPQ